MRLERAPTGTLLVRGGPDTSAKLRTHAQPSCRAFVLDGAPVLGISMFAALDDVGLASPDELLARRLSSYRFVHLASIDRLEDSEFGVLESPAVAVVVDLVPHPNGTIVQLDGLRVRPARWGTQSRVHLVTLIRSRKHRAFATPFQATYNFLYVSKEDERCGP